MIFLRFSVGAAVAWFGHHEYRRAGHLVEHGWGRWFDRLDESLMANVPVELQVLLKKAMACIFVIGGSVMAVTSLV